MKIYGYLPLLDALWCKAALDLFRSKLRLSDVVNWMILAYIFNIWLNEVACYVQSTWQSQRKCLNIMMQTSVCVKTAPFSVTLLDLIFSAFGVFKYRLCRTFCVWNRSTKDLLLFDSLPEGLFTERDLGRGYVELLLSVQSIQTR